MIDFTILFSMVHSTIATFGMSLNLLLIYLALFHSPKALRSYATLIINFALTDFFACFFDFFVQQRIIPAGLTLGYVSNGVCKYFGPTTCYVGHSLMLHFMSHSLLSLLLSFSYRCYILHNPAPSRPTIILIILTIYLPSLFQWISFLWAQDEPAEVVEILQAKFPAYNFTDQCVTGTKNIVCFSALYTVFYMTLPVTPAYICILLLRRNIISTLSVKEAKLSKNTRKLHSQLLMALIYQAAIPGFYVFSVTSYTIGQLEVYNSPALEYFTFSCAIFIPFLSPIASLVFVTPYRRAIKNKIIRTTKTEPTETSLTFHKNTITRH